MNSASGQLAVDNDIHALAKAYTSQHLEHVVKNKSEKSILFIHSDMLKSSRKKRMASAVFHSFGSDGPPPIRPESVESAVTRLSHQGNKE
jgi:hypothetical protein